MSEEQEAAGDSAAASNDEQDERAASWLSFPFGTYGNTSINTGGDYINAEHFAVINAQKADIEKTLQEELLYNQKREETFSKSKAFIEKTFKTICKVARECYPEERLWLDTHENNIGISYAITRLLTVVIHYPELTITDDNNYTHVIRELYIEVTFWIQTNESGHISRFKVTPKGTRGEVNQYEANSNYCHSHMNYDSDDKPWQEFCLGETDLQDIILEMEIQGRDGKLKDAEDMCFALFSALDAYLCVESREGVPYQYIGNLITSYRMGRQSLLSGEVLRGCMAKFVQLTPEPCSFENLKAQIEQVGLSHFNEQALVSVSEDGDYLYPISNEEIEAVEFNATPFTFKDKTISCRMVPVNEGTGVKKIVNPDVVNYIKKNIDEEITNYAIIEWQGQKEVISRELRAKRRRASRFAKFMEKNFDPVQDGE